MSKLLPILALLACSQPVPKPTALDAGPADIFTNAIENCRLQIVQTERDGAMSDVRGCLVQDGVDACMVKQSGQYRPETVACVARDLGARANAAYLAGSNDPRDKQMADSARRFIQTHNLGYR